MENYPKEREEFNKKFLRDNPQEIIPRFIKQDESHLPQRKVDSEQTMEMIKHGYNPLNMEHVLLFELHKSEGKIINQKFEWKLTFDQIKELEELERMKEVYGTAYGFILEDTLASFLPMADTRSQFKEVNDYVDKIVNDEPIWFKNNKSFYQKKK